MRAVDTNVLVRIAIGDDPRQTRVADSFIENGAWVSLLALAEATWVLRKIYNRTSDEVATAVAMLLAHESLVLQEADAVQSALNLFRSRPKLGFADCLILEIARKAGHLPLGTFDRGLAKVSGTQQL